MTRVPTEFDLELQAERERWLRRRLLWLCGVGAVMELAANLPKLWNHLHTPGHQAEGWVDFIEGTLLVFLYASAGGYALWHKLKQPSLLRLVFWLVIIVAAVELISSRAKANLFLLAEISPDQQAKAATISMAAALMVLTFDHFLACVFMPWTVRESLRPAAVLLGMYSLSLLSGMLRRRRCRSWCSARFPFWQSVSFPER